MPSIVTEKKLWFPILGGMSHQRNGRTIIAAGCPMYVPWDMVVAHTPQALANHHQSVEHLAERGGLDPSELVAVLEDRAWREMTIEDAVAQVHAQLKAWKEQA